MSTSSRRPIFARTVLASAVAAALLAACASTPMKPSGAEAAREKLIALQTDPTLGRLAPAAMQDAEAAVRAAQLPQADRGLADYRVYIADRKVDIARAVAQARYAARERKSIIAQREKIRLEGRTQEADVANARAQAATQRSAEMQRQSAEMQRQIDALRAKVTHRGLVLTLGDLLFSSGRSQLKAGASGDLARLAAFLNRYPGRTAAIEGYTDNVGSRDYNQGLSERRAEAVQSYLTAHGVDPSRLHASGGGESDPVADNGTAGGRRQNRRVEVLISQPTPVAAN